MDRDLLKILVKTGVTLSAHSRRTLPGISSGPVALFGLMLRSFNTPGIVTKISVLSSMSLDL